MKNLLILFLCCPFFLIAQQNLSFQHGAQNREYILYLPDDLPADAPLIFVLHGYTSTAFTIMNYCNMNTRADMHKFAVCYPQGTRDYSGITHWNANLSISTTDDIGFLSELADYLQSEYDLNPQHTFACGMSNGGFMSYTLACEKPDVFKAIASVTGTMSGYSWNNCNPSQPVPVFQISGIIDNVVPINGSMSPLGGWGGAPHIESVIDFWKDLNDCSTTEETTLTSSINATFHRNGVNNNEVWFYLLKNWGHAWPGPWPANFTGIDASEEIWDFFSLVISNSVTSIDESSTKNDDIFIYPNPTKAFVTIEFKNKKPSNYELYNIYGQLILSGSTHQDQLKIDLSDLPQGIYTLQADGQAANILKSN